MSHFFFQFWPSHGALGPGTKPAPLHGEGGVLTVGLPGGPSITFSRLTQMVTQWLEARIAIIRSKHIKDELSVTSKEVRPTIDWLISRSNSI